MRSRVEWTQERDDRLMALRRGGMTWDDIATDMSLGRNTVLERGRRIGAKRVAQARQGNVEEPRDRPARQAGHPLTWDLINRGTVLEGEAYPYPVFL